MIQTMSCMQIIVQHTPYLRDTAYGITALRAALLMEAESRVTAILSALMNISMTAVQTYLTVN